MWTEFELIKGLKWYTKGAVRAEFDSNKDWRPTVKLYNYHTGDFMTDLDVGGRGLNVYNSQTFYTNLYSYLAYKKSFSQKHNFNFQAGYSQESNHFEFLNGYRERYSSTELLELDAGSPAVQNASGSSNDWAIQSVFGRIGYNYDERYLLEVNMRYDGTSRLSPDNRWGAFPSVSAGFFIDRFRNKLVEFGAEEISGNQIFREGLPYGSFYLLEQIGIFQTAEEVSNSAKQFNDNTLPGDLKFKDQNNDGVINDDDRIVIGNPFPKFEYSFNLSASFKGFDIAAFVQGVKARDIYVNNWGTIPFVQGAPPTVDWRNRWTEENPSTTMPRMYWGWNDSGKSSRASSYYLQDASYLRVKNLSVGYSFPKSFISKINVSKLRVYFSGDNLFTFTDYPGLDPERAGNGNFVSYPQNKIYAFGLQVQL